MIRPDTTRIGSIICFLSFHSLLFRRRSAFRLTLPAPYSAAAFMTKGWSMAGLKSHSPLTDMNKTNWRFRSLQFRLINVSSWADGALGRVMRPKQGQWQSPEEAGMFLSHISNLSECIFTALTVSIAIQLIEKGCKRSPPFLQRPTSIRSEYGSPNFTK
jgi:hypothetical protein